MAVLRYRDYYISVFLTPDKSGNSSCMPFVEIRYKRDPGPAARLMLNEAFGSASDASAHGFEKGKEWIDDRVAERNSGQTGGVVTKSDEEPLLVRFGFKSWFGSLLFWQA